MDELLNNQRKKIVELIKEKSVMKQDVYKNTLLVFDMLKQVLHDISISLKNENIDKRVIIEAINTTQHGTQLKVAGDMLEFFMYSNVFEFDKSHPMFKTGYVKKNEYNSYCGIINVYNFLADSFKYNRANDLGYLICRIFVNREMHFFIETKTQMGYKYSSFSEEPINKEILTDIVNELIIYAISFDLFTPPYDSVREVSVNEIQEKVNSMNLRIGKRLGYGTEASSDEDFIL